MITVYDKIVHKKLNGVDIVNIGITGSIACGKSTVSNYLIESIKIFIYFSLYG